MVYNIDFDICALLFSSAMLFIFHYKKGIPNLQNKIFGMFLWLCLIAAIADTADGIITLSRMFYATWVQRVVLYFYFVAINFLPVLYALYCVAITGTQEKLLTGGKKWAFFIPGGISAAIIVLNPFLHSLFYFDELGRYHRGFGILLLNINAFYFMILGICFIRVYRQIVPKAKRFALYSFVLFVTLPVLIQLFMPSMYVTTLGVTLCIFFIFMTIQNPEEIVSETGLLNRNALLSTADIYFCKKEKFTAIAIKINDYNYFKHVFGAETMRNFLYEIAGMLTRFYIRGKQAYYAGDGRFVLLFPSQEMKEELAGQILKLFDSEIETAQMNINFSASACVIACPNDADNADALMRYVDYAEWEGAQRQSSVCLASAISLSSEARIKEIEKAVEYALNNNGLSVHYQPIFSVKEQRINSMEALVRLYDDKLGNIVPDEFIPITERNGTIIRVGMYVFRSVCEFYVTNNLKKSGIDYVEVNLSVTQCMQKKLAENLLAVMEEYHIPYECINLEITETMAAASSETLSGTMQALAGKGIKFSLDDYGTGFSNIISLIELPFSLVKIDKVLISKLHDKRTQIAVTNTIAMLKNLNMKIVAEGVETEEQADMLTELACDYLQGYYFSRPLPGNSLNSKIEEINRKYSE